MKTAGELLREKRLILELDLATVSAKTKIKPEYLQAIEESHFADLPSSTFAMGFLRSYANCLHLNAETMVAMFRRDFTQNRKGEIIPRGLVTPVNAKPKFLSVNLILLSIGVVAFAGFLGWQLTSWWSLPKLKILQPQNGDTYGEKVTVKGTSEQDAAVSINGQKVILDQNGQFSLDLVFPAGTHSVLITATNRQGKTRQAERTFTVSK
ncbi:MAG: helix-turn-helix domain-containing protein [bacterium]